MNAITFKLVRFCCLGVMTCIALSSPSYAKDNILSDGYIPPTGCVTFSWEADKNCDGIADSIKLDVEIDNVVSPPKKRKEIMGSSGFCRKMLKRGVTAETLANYAYSNCMRMLSDRGDIIRTILRAKNGKCTDKRVGSTARRANKLWKEGKKGKTKEQLMPYAEKLRLNSISRSSMYSSCWKTTVNNLTTKTGGTVVVGHFD